MGNDRSPTTLKTVMLKSITSLALTLCCLSMVNAQNVITRMSGGQSHFYYDPGPSVPDGQWIQDIIDSASVGDTIYLGGDNYVLDADHPIHQDKHLVIVGTGWHADSTIASGRTRISRVQGPSWWLDLGSDRSEFHGLFFDDVPVAINGYETNSAIDSLRFVRCRMSSLALGTQTGNSWATEVSVEQCVMGSFDFHNVATATLKNSIVAGISRGIQGSLVENCILLNFEPNNGYGNDGLTYRSCIFTRTMTSPYTVNASAIFLNNRWVLQTNGTLDFGANVIAQNGNGAVTSMAEAFLGATNYTSFDEDADYSVVSEFLTAGYDGTQVGIYGGPGPVWKDGALPFNPHWKLLTTPGSTNNGILPNVHIQATAQPH